MRERPEDFPDYECKRHGRVEPKVSRTKRGYLHRRCPLCLKETFDKSEWQRRYRAGRRVQKDRVYAKVEPWDPFFCKIHGSVEPLLMKRRHGFLRLCAACKRERSTRYAREYVARCQKKVYAAYGGACFCCRERNPLFLTVDHIDSNGWRERAEDRTNIYVRLVQRGFPTDNYRIACYNCNSGRARNGGICPHTVGQG